MNDLVRTWLDTKSLDSFNLKNSDAALQALQNKVTNATDIEISTDETKSFIKVNNLPLLEDDKTLTLSIVCRADSDGELSFDLKPEIIGMSKILFNFTCFFFLNSSTNTMNNRHAFSCHDN